LAIVQPLKSKSSDAQYPAMTFETLLEILALVAFVVAAIGWSYRKIDLLAIGLALWSLAVLIPRLNGITVSTVVLLLAFVAFVAAAIGWRYRKINLIAVGLALWMVSLLLGPVLHIS
jgi:hypothetical protein